MRQWTIVVLALLLSGAALGNSSLLETFTGNGLGETKAYDLQGRLTGWAVSGRLNRPYAHDAKGNVVQQDLAQFQFRTGDGHRPGLGTGRESGLLQFSLLGAYDEDTEFVDGLAKRLDVS